MYSYSDRGPVRKGLTLSLSLSFFISSLEHAGERGFGANAAERDETLKRHRCTNDALLLEMGLHKTQDEAIFGKILYWY